MDSWTCLMVQKGPGMLDDEIRLALKKAACCLSLASMDAMRIRETGCEGHIETEWRSYTVGGRSGILFRCAIETGARGGEFRVNFLLNRSDLERGREILERYEAGESDSWERGTAAIPLPQLYDFSDLNNRQSTRLH
jgi:hypothetical protein